ncbi:TssQ family T6SS-associated lipoprotein [Aquabacterium sp.]|uniref:TssQ family T6SS-associated lipoprotein n=1 Tax=Aquabacterium sp. TaxID=1872578 RepID=UPI0035B2A3A6
MNHAFNLVRRGRIAALALLTIGSLLGCAQPQAPVVGVMDLTDRPAEKALLSGLRAYDDGQYPEAEKQFGAALQAGLASPRDKAAAHKYLAFIYCSTQRTGACEVEFRAAKEADSRFALSKSEAGHPMWGPVYRKVFPAGQ